MAPEIGWDVLAELERREAAAARKPDPEQERLAERFGVGDPAKVPREMLEAQGEAALRAISADGKGDPVNQRTSSMALVLKPRSGTPYIERAAKSGMRPSENVDDRVHAERQALGTAVFEEFERKQWWVGDHERFLRWIRPLRVRTFALVDKVPRAPAEAFELLAIAKEVKMTYEGLAEHTKKLMSLRDGELLEFIIGMRTLVEHPSFCESPTAKDVFPARERKAGP